MEFFDEKHGKHQDFHKITAKFHLCCNVFHSFIYFFLFLSHTKRFLIKEIAKECVIELIRFYQSSSLLISTDNSLESLEWNEINENYRKYVTLRDYFYFSIILIFSSILLFFYLFFYNFSQFSKMIFSFIGILWNLKHIWFIYFHWC